MGAKDKKESHQIVLDLEAQSLIHDDCVIFVDELTSSETSLAVQTISVEDVENIVTNFSKSSNLTYSAKNGWLEILRPLFVLEMSMGEVEACFNKIVKNYIPKCFNTIDEEEEKVAHGQPYHLLRLLLFYHDPELGSFLDTKRITPDLYAASWFRSLFAGHCSLKVSQALWDIYFQSADPFLMFYLALVILVNSK